MANEQAVEQLNQCDGCMQRLPTTQVSQYGGEPQTWHTKGVQQIMRCTKDRYSLPKEEKKLWNNKDKNCTNGCDEKHICVVCVCDDCGTCDLETMKCNCSLPTETEGWIERYMKFFNKEVNLSPREKICILNFLIEEKQISYQAGKREAIEFARGMKDRIHEYVYEMRTVKDPICKSGYDTAKREIIDFITQLESDKK